LRVNCDNVSPRVAAYVLAGGGSTRFGRDKALVEIAGRPMLTRMCCLLAGVTREVTIVAAGDRYGSLGTAVVADRWPGEGPLGGIITALRETEARSEMCEWSLILSCDMPFLTCEWLSFLASRAMASAAQAVLPRSQQGLEPLSACYKTSARGALQSVFDAGERKITRALQGVKTEILEEADWKKFDPAGRLFWNMNTPADYDEAKRILEAERA
jgi:molybdenum cofactor guanylyltransferase